MDPFYRWEQVRVPGALAPPAEAVHEEQPPALYHTVAQGHRTMLQPCKTWQHLKDFDWLPFRTYYMTSRKSPHCIHLSVLPQYR